jgi:hypothetical protein
VQPPSLPGADPAQKRQEQRVRSKKNLEFAHLYVLSVIEEVNRKEQEKLEAEVQLERAV